MTTRLITDAQMTHLHQVCSDVEGLLDCNCSIDGCDGTCTHAMAIAGMAILDGLTATSDLETKLREAGGDFSEIEQLLDGTFTPLKPGGDEGDRSYVETAYLIARRWNRHARFTVNLHTVNLITGDAVQEVYRGDSETEMYSHVSAIEHTLALTRATADIEIVEDGRERWIDYQDGVRDDATRHAK